MFKEKDVEGMVIYLTCHFTNKSIKDVSIEYIEQHGVKSKGWVAKVNCHPILAFYSDNIWTDKTLALYDLLSVICIMVSKNAMGTINHMNNSENNLGPNQFRF